MAVYFANKVGFHGAQTITSGWSQNNEHPLFAVSSQGGSIGVYTDEGDPLDPQTEPQIKTNRGSDAVVLKWHPFEPILAIGWNDGVLSFWSQREKRMSEDKATHARAIKSMAWSPDGTRLVTGDDSGKVGVWKMDRLRPVPIIQYQEREGAINRVCFKVETPEAAMEGAPCVFYYAVAGDKGVVCEADDAGHKTQLFDTDSPSAALLFYKEKNAVVSLSATCMLTVHGKMPSGNWKSLLKAKLPTMEGTSSMQVTWVNQHVLASASDKDSMVRLFNLDTEENFVLSMGDQNATKKISSLAFNSVTNTLAAGTKEGRVSMWQYIGTASTQAETEGAHNPEEDWKMLPGSNLNTRIVELCWGPNMRLLGVTCIESCYVLSKCILQHKLCDSKAAIQLSENKVMVENRDGSSSQELQTQIHITGLDITDTHCAVWSGKKAEIYDITNVVRQTASFPSQSTSCGLYRESFYRCVGNKIEVCNLQGTVKQTLMLEAQHGKATCLHLNGEFLAACTSHQYIKLWKGRRIEVDGAAGPLGAILSIRVNPVGSKVSILAASHENSAKHDSRVAVYDLESDTFSTYDFGPEGRLPEKHQWDIEDEKLLAVETRTTGTIAEMEEGDLQSAEVVVTSLFSTPLDGVLLQENTRLPPVYEGLIGMLAPNLYVFQKITADSMLGREDPYLESLTMQQFHGLDHVDDETRRALLSFSYHLAVGNMDEAYKAVKKIKNPEVWENMAHMCIKMKRLDVAEYCLGNMGHIAGARAIREASEYKEVDARVATVAVQLGLIGDAQKLFAGCERYDLVNVLHQACGEWEAALAVAEKHDRIHLCTTWYNYAKHLEAVGDMANAVQAYEKSQTHRQEVPRMLYEGQQLDELENYIIAKKDKDLTKWWARYCESTGDLEKATECYTTANDYMALVRIACMQGQFEEAREIAEQSGDPAAAFHIGRQYDHQDDVPNAIHFYSKAGRFGNAIQLAKKHRMDKDLMALALQATPREQVEVATYFAEKNRFDQAVLLYQKGGKVALALDLCFTKGLFEPLQVIASELGQDSDPALLKKCAQFFMDHMQFSKAVQLLVDAKEGEKALDLAILHNVLITEEMAEAMTPPKESAHTAEERVSILRRIGKCAKRQGSYHLACKKYTQAGDKEKAMKVLLKSGDVEKVIFFAGVSRQREIYIMAANYLQTLDWHNDADIMKSIIQFYTKARAMDSLSTFYEACAQIEIDEYRDYEKALGALRESLKYMQKARTGEKEDRVDSLTQRINLCERFVQARKHLKTDPEEMVRICNGLLDHSPADADLEQAIRVGDVFALMIEYYHGIQNYKSAYQLIEKMQARKIILSPYLDQELVSTVYKGVGMPLNTGAMEQDDDDGVGEEIDEEI